MRISLRRFLVMVAIVSLVLGIVVATRRGQRMKLADEHSQRANGFRLMANDESNLADMIDAGKVFGVSIPASALRAQAKTHAKLADVHSQMCRDILRQW